MEEEDISPDQTEKLIQFQDLTGIDDMAQCKELLKSNNWDLETAVQHHLVQQDHTDDSFHSNGGLPHQQLPHQQLPPPLPPLERRASSTARPVREPPVNVNPIDQRIFSVLPRRNPPTGIFGWTSFLIFLPFRFFYTTFYDILSFVYRLFRPDPRLMVTDPLGDVMQLVNSYDARYGPVHPVFYQGTYAQALNAAKTELTFLIVYLHSENNSDCDSFCRETLVDAAVIDLVNSRSLFWICGVETAEGYRVSRALQRRTATAVYPFVAMIVLRENRMSVVARFEGLIESARFVSSVTRVINDNETSLEVARADKREREISQHLRQEQDAAFLESLLVDQEKERKKKEEEEEKQRELETSLREAEVARQEAEMVEELKGVLMTLLPPEPSGDDKDCVRILLKCPSGLRLERRFRKTQPIQDLFNYIFCHHETPDDFSIIKNFPRSEIPGSPPKLQEYRCLLAGSNSNGEPAPPPPPASPSFADVGLSSSEMLFVQDNLA